MAGIGTSARFQGRLPRLHRAIPSAFLDKIPGCPGLKNCFKCRTFSIPYKICRVLFSIISGIKMHQRCRKPDFQQASSACKRSVRISSRSSSPTEILISPGVMFTAIRSASLSFAWVVLAGCDAMLRVSPRFAVRERS